MADEVPTRSPRGRWLRYSLRTLLVLVTLFAIVLAYSVSRFAKERAAVEAVLARGGRVVYFDRNVGLVHPERTPIAWAREFVRLRWPHGVYLEGSNDETIAAAVLPLRTVAYVGIRGGQVTNEGLARLAALDSLVGVSCIRDRRNEKAIDELDQPTTIDFNQTPLQDSIDYLADLHGIRFRIDEPKIPEDLRTRRTGLTAAIKGKTLSNALKQLLSPHGLGWVVVNGEIKITSRDNQLKHEEEVAKVKAALPQLKQLIVD